MTGDGEDPAQNATTSPTSARLVESLVCPATGGRLNYDPDRNELISKSANLAYPIRSGIPIMLIDEARTLDE